MQLACRANDRATTPVAVPRGTGAGGRCAQRRAASSAIAYVLLVAHLTPCGAGAGLEWPGCTEEVLAHFPGGWPHSLDWGLYWHSPDGRVGKANGARKSDFYDPANNTVIFFPGWHGEGRGTTPYCYRSSTFCDPDVCHDQRPMMGEWFRRGYNVGFFYWDQFADEQCARDAEQKIWIVHDEGIRWASYDPQTSQKSMEGYPPSKNMSLADLAVNDLNNILGQFHGQSLRFIGHSLGAQLAAASAQKLWDMKSNARPTRLTMLDAIFTERHLHFFRCGKWHTRPGVGNLAADDTAKAIESLWMHGVATENVKSSAFSRNARVNDPNVVLNHMTLTLQYYPDFCDSEYKKRLKYHDNWECRHKAAVLTYFEGMGDESPELLGTGFGGYGIKGACLVPSAACSDDEVKGLMHTQEKTRTKKKKDVSWTQAEGQGTPEVSDDKYKLLSYELSDDDTAAKFLPTAPPDLFNGEGGIRPDLPHDTAGDDEEAGPPLPKPTLKPVKPTGKPAGGNAAAGGDTQVTPPAASPAGAAGSDGFGERVTRMPRWKKWVALVFTVAGVGLLMYAMQPCGLCCPRGARSGRFRRFKNGSSDEDSESGSGFGSYSDSAE